MTTSNELAPGENEEVLEIAELPAISIRWAPSGPKEATAKAVVVMLHGFQMTPRDLSPFAHSLGLPAWFLFPRGPLEAKPAGRAWWHIDHVLRDQAIAKGPRDFNVQHPPDLPNARERLTRFLEAVHAMKPTPETPLILAGFSQGGMLSCDTLLRASALPPISALALLSASRIAADEWEPYLASDACRVKGLPVLVSHGETDNDLAFSAGVALKECLERAGAKVTWVPFEQGHEIPLVVWRHLRKLVSSFLR